MTRGEPDTMSDSDTQSREEAGAIQHLEEALESEEREQVDYHIRQALQLLGVRDQ